MVFVLCIWYLVFTLIIQVTEIMKAFKILTSIEHTASKPSDHGASTCCLVLLKSLPPHP